MHGQRKLTALSRPIDFRIKGYLFKKGGLVSAFTFPSSLCNRLSQRYQGK